MAKVNYVREHIRFMEYAADAQLSPAERLLWYALMHIMNQRASGRDWPDGFEPVSNERLLTYCPMKYDAILSARKSLQERGLIDYRNGVPNRTAPAYRVNYFFPDGDLSTGSAGQPEDERALFGGYSEDTEALTGGYSEDTEALTGSYSEKPVEKSDIYINVNPNVNPNETQTDDDLCTTTTTTAAALVDNSSSDSKRPPVRTKRERRQYDAVEAFMDACDAPALFGPALKQVRAILNGGQHPVELVGHALALTYERARRAPLHAPAAYMRSLLTDWDGKGLRTVADVEAARAGYAASG